MSLPPPRTTGTLYASRAALYPGRGVLPHHFPPGPIASSSLYYVSLVTFLSSLWERRISGASRRGCRGDRPHLASTIGSLCGRRNPPPARKATAAPCRRKLRLNRDSWKCWWWRRRRRRGVEQYHEGRRYRAGSRERCCGRARARPPRRRAADLANHAACAHVCEQRRDAQDLRRAGAVGALLSLS